MLLEFWQTRNCAVDASHLLAKIRWPQMSPSFIAEVVRKSGLCDPTKRYYDFLAPLLLVADGYHKMSKKKKAKANFESRFSFEWSAHEHNFILGPL